MCKIDGCGKPTKCRSMCKQHYESWLITAEPSQKQQRKIFPPNDVLIQMAKDSKSLTDLAQQLDVTRKSLKIYISKHQELSIVLDLAIKKLTPEEVLANDNLAKQRWKENNRERVREINRRWARNQSPEKRAKWNHYNKVKRINPLAEKPNSDTIEYAKIVNADPCSYCSGIGGTIDHIIPISDGGENIWTNYTGACRSCNSSKNNTPLLQYMLRESIKEDKRKAKS